MYVAKFWDGNRFAVGVAREGRKLVHLVSIEDSGVRVHSLPLEEAKTFRKVPLFKSGIDYPVGRACRKMLDTGRRIGITDAAKAILKEGLEQPA